MTVRVIPAKKIHEQGPFTSWKNPTQDHIEFELPLCGWDSELRPSGKVGPTGNQVMIPRAVRHVRLAPGESIALPSVYDNAIQCVRDGRIQSGLAPQLTRTNGAAPPPVPHPAIVAVPPAAVATRAESQEERLARRIAK